jgi:hypothetical protein
MAEALKSEITLGERKQRKTFPKRDQFAAELEYFSGCVLTTRSPSRRDRAVWRMYGLSRLF